MRHNSFDYDNYPGIWATCMFNANQEATRKLNQKYAEQTRYLDSVEWQQSY